MVRQLIHEAPHSEAEILQDIAGVFLVGYTDRGGKIAEFRLTDNAPDIVVEQVEQALGRDFGSGQYAPRGATAIQEAIKDEPSDSPIRLLGEALLGKTAQEIEAARSK